jgi:hypothetical protein
VGLAAAASFLAFFRLGSPSYFIDEVFSVQSALHSLGQVYGPVRHLETSPPGYFWLLHEWVGRTGVEGESGFRALSALAGVGLVLCVWRIGIQVAGPAAGALAGLLAALSPFVVQYEQLARPYAVVMLALAVAVWAALRARDDARWLALSAVGAVGALWLHYMAWVTVLPLCAWVALDPAFPGRGRVAFVAACLAGGAVWIPLAVHQFDTYPNGGGLPGVADLKPSNLLGVIAGPFEGRHPLSGARGAGGGGGGVGGAPAAAAPGATQLADWKRGVWRRFSTRSTPSTAAAARTRRSISSSVSRRPRRNTTPFSALTLTCALETPASRKATLSTLLASETSSSAALLLRPGTACAARWATPSATPSAYRARRIAARERLRTIATPRSRAMWRRRLA